MPEPYLLTVRCVFNLPISNAANYNQPRSVLFTVVGTAGRCEIQIPADKKDDFRVGEEYSLIIAPVTD